ncbi:MAG: hypothetical protein H0U72_04480 [Nitrosospira sp.]|nr:hypothetical protein [Nitrosospira sp.]
MGYRYGICILTATIILIFGLLKPEHNWDMIAYVAASYYKDGYRGPDLTRETYEDIKKEVSSKTFSKLITGKYRETVFGDPSSLEQQIPFYSIRVGYIELIRLLKKVGLNYAKSTYVISAIFASLSVLVLGLIVLTTTVPIGILPIVVAVTGYTELARLSTPDAMACFFSLLGIYSLMKKERLIFLVAAILPLIRTDFILLSGLLMIYTYLHGRRFLSLFSLLFSVAFYILINKLYGNYGYLTLFNFTFIGSLTPYPADIVISHKFSDYLIPYALLLNNLIFHSHSAIYVLAVYLLWLKRDQVKAHADYYYLFGIPLVFTIAHMLLFPTMQYRFFVFSASLILVWSLSVLSQPARKEAVCLR